MVSKDYLWRRRVQRIGLAVILLLAGIYGLQQFIEMLARQKVVLPEDSPGVIDEPLSSVASSGSPGFREAQSAAASAEESLKPASLAESSLPGLGGMDAIEGEYVLTFRDAAARDRLLAMARRYGVRILDRYGLALRVGAENRGALAEWLRSAGGAVSIEPNLWVRIPLLDESSESLPAPLQPYLGFGDKALAWLGVPDPDAAWGSGVKVAVLDTGISGIAVAQRLDLVGGAAGAEHGSMVGSILRQMLPGADLLDVRVMRPDGTGDTFTVAKGIREAVDAGADIINLSLGTRGDSGVLAAAVRYAVERGVLLVASAGNEGVDRVSYPAAYEEVLSVAAVDADERHLHFSNRGEQIDLAAPGVGVSLVFPGRDPIVFSGTSAAAPFVTAAAGLARGLDPSLDGAMLRDLLPKLANDTGEPGRNELTGAGIVSPVRILERGEAGVIDMAVMRPIFKADETGRIQSVTIAAQNRGTQDLGALQMSVTVNGQEYDLGFEGVQAGRTVAHQMDVRGYTDEDGVVDVTIRLHDIHGDRRPNDNQFRAVGMPAPSSR